MRILKLLISFSRETEFNLISIVASNITGLKMITLIYKTIRTIRIRAQKTGDIEKFLRSSYASRNK